MNSREAIRTTAKKLLEEIGENLEAQTKPFGKT
jgi:hypothetical protein